MVAEYWKTVVRKPRHAGGDTGAWKVEVEYRVGAKVAVVEARLADGSRDGAQVVVPIMLPPKDRVVVRFVDEHSEVRYQAEGEIRWSRAGDNKEVWSSGIRFSEPIDFETLGELFLNDLLHVDSEA